MKLSVEIMLEDTPVNRKKLEGLSKLEAACDSSQLVPAWNDQVDVAMEFGKKYRLTIESV